MQELIERVHDLKSELATIETMLARIGEADKVFIMPVVLGAHNDQLGSVSFLLSQPLLFSALLKQRAEVERQLSILSTTFVTDTGDDIPSVMAGYHE